MFHPSIFYRSRVTTSLSRRGLYGLMQGHVPVSNQADFMIEALTDRCDMSGKWIGKLGCLGFKQLLQVGLVVAGHESRLSGVYSAGINMVSHHSCTGCFGQ